MTTEPRVVAILVTHNGAAMLRRTLTSVAAQTHGSLDLVAVDNGSTDGTTALLIELLGSDRVIPAEEDLGFPVAIDLALDVVDARAAAEGRSTADDLVLVLHDDLELAPDAVSRLVEALRDDERVAIVGPKLRWADDPDRLQSVGATIDLTGRVDDGIDPGELDQGQRDGDRRVLFVPTAGMLVRRSTFDAIGRFDERFHAFREDLDLCWRAALAGYDVEVVPAAVAQHASLSAEHLRPGRVAELGPRFLAERNTLAALLKNYEARRLVLLLPLALLVGAAKVVGFLVTRRLGDARDTVVAWGWNAVNLRGTLRRRRRVQALRRRSDVELAPLFGRVTPRLRAYLEAVLDRIAGDALPGEASIAEYAPSAMLMGELTTELEDELLEDEEPISLADEEQSLADIFREFKKGVEQQLDSEDYDTHYNLGIAYKEMGLIDEAIGEFQVASKDPARVIECCSMLGLCFLEKGMPQLAVKWYKKGLESPEITEDENLGLLYDLGIAYLESGDTAAAQKAFMEVYGVNSNYRDIVGKMKQIEESRK
jgi:GT2 family glycosyltransferase